MQPVENQNGSIDNYTQPQIIQTSISDKTIKELGEVVVSVVTALNQGKYENEIELAKQETEQAKAQREVDMEQLKSDERITTTLIKWNIIFKCFVLSVSFGSIVAVQLLGGTTLTTIIAPVVTFLLGSVFKNQIGDFTKTSTKKIGKGSMSKSEDE